MTVRKPLHGKLLAVAVAAAFGLCGPVAPWPDSTANAQASVPTRTPSTAPSASKVEASRNIRAPGYSPYGGCNDPTRAFGYGPRCIQP